MFLLSLSQLGHVPAISPTLYWPLIYDDLVFDQLKPPLIYYIIILTKTAQRLINLNLIIFKANK